MEVNVNKKILIVDDSDVDRVMLKAMLCGEFEIVEKCGGYTAIDFLKENRNKLDIILLDVSMPGMDGFGVLQFMKDNGIKNLPVLLITSEATRDNVQKARQYNVSGFLKKPFEKEDILKRIRQQFGIITEYELTNAHIRETYRYIEELEVIYKRYLINFGEDYEHYLRMKDVMKILLTKYAAFAKNKYLDSDHIEIISKAGFFCDIGNMVVPPETVKILKTRKLGKDGYQNHTILGADLIGLNHSEYCQYFVDICTDICLHHHERYDGKGFPHKITGDYNLIYTQICRLVDNFDNLFIKYLGHNEQQFEFVLNDLIKDEGNVSRDVFSILKNCKTEVIQYYQAID